MAKNKSSIPKHHSFTGKHTGLAKDLKSKVFVGEPIDPKSGNVSNPNGPEFWAIWDTGATGSVITDRVVQCHGLPQMGMAKVHHVGGKGEQPIYMISLYLPNKVVIPFVRVTKGELIGDADILIGMDIISRGDLSITNRSGNTWFTFRMPSLQHIDFVSYKPNAEHGCLCGSGKRYKNCCLKNPG